MKDWQLQVERAQHGDRRAFDRLVVQFEGMAVGYACSILRDFDLAEDAAQEAFIEAYFGLSKLREARAFPAWFRKVVFKYCDRHMRKNRISTVGLDNAVELPSPSESPYQAVERHELHAAVMAAVETLPEKERSVIMLAYMGGGSLAEVGEFLGIPASTVKSRLYSARQRLKERMVGLMEEDLKQHTPSDLGRRVSRVLDGIERIHWRETSCLCFVGSTAACMRYIGEDVDTDYIMGVSGGAFKLFWHPAWSPANCDLLLYGEEPVRRTFEALGYAYMYISDRGREKPQSYYQDLIVRSIDRGHPVIAVGIVGPPECCVVAGYDRGGDVLYGRSYFQENPFGGDTYEQMPEGYFRTDKWYENFYGCILIGDKHEKPSDTEIMRKTLDWAIRLAREPEFDSPGFAASCGEMDPDDPGYVEGCGAIPSETHLSGLAAYDAIIEALGRDEDYPADNPDVLSFRCIALGNDGLCLLAEKRRAASSYLSQMAALDLPAAEKLAEAAEIYAEESKLLFENMHLIPKWNSPKEVLGRLSDPTTRSTIARVMREAKALDEKAVELLEEALLEYEK